MGNLHKRSFGAKLRTGILRVAMRVASDRDLWSEHRVSIEGMRRGGVRVAFSVLYCAEEEFDLEHFGDAPEDAYFKPLLEQMNDVEADLAIWDDDVAAVVRNRAELDAQLATDEGIAMVHCVEGGFHLGASVERIEENVKTLADRGVAYITLAHLFYRDVATNSNALPFMRDGFYHRVFPQPGKHGLTKRGKVAVQAMIDNRVIVDLSHMNAHAIHETLDILDHSGTDMPVIASHAGYRFGDQEYMLDDRTIDRIKERDGVIGLIMAQHQLNDGIVDETETIDQSFDVIRRHVNRIAERTGGLRHVAIGSDLDGFIKPTMGGIESISDLGLLEDRLVGEYGAAASLVASENALRVLRAAWV
jgi:microsomal dipeptidase-like Zn-dependent dipeptidase